MLQACQHRIGPELRRLVITSILDWSGPISVVWWLANMETLSARPVLQPPVLL